ncbi:MAG: DUF3168 domain-containing protein [Thermoleophilia bacterium]|nr:DUF3168 domain-containing protein [Thermoleophilia bacterium]
MSFEAALNTYLKAHAGLSALVGARIYPDLMPEGTSSDCVTWQVVGGRELHIANYVEPTLLIKSYSKSRLSTVAIDDQVRSALETYHGMIGDYHVRVMTDLGPDDYEQDTGWRVRMRYARPFYRHS